MPNDAPGPLDSNRRLFLARLNAREVPVQEALSILKAMRTRLELLHNLDEVTQQTEFANQGADIQSEIAQQEKEIRELELYVSQEGGNFK